MKYIINIFTVILCISVAVSAQTDTLNKSKKANLYSKKGISILPEEGEIALGINAAPFLTYLGGVLSDAGEDSPSVSYGTRFTGNYGIYGKYMLASDMAVRASFRFDMSTDKDIYVVPKSTLAYDPYRPEYVEDIIKTKSNDICITLGLEKRRGKSRVQGVYGAEVVYGYNKTNRFYEYGNPITNEFNTPDIDDAMPDYTSNGRRMVERYDNEGMFTGLRGLLGVEFFFGPKMSLGAEFGYSVLYEWGANENRLYEYWDANRSQVSHMSTRTDNPGYGDFSLGIDNLDGSINLFLYF